MAFTLNAGAAFSGSLITPKHTCRAARAPFSCRAQQKGKHGRKMPSSCMASHNWTHVVQLTHSMDTDWQRCQLYLGKGINAEYWLVRTPHNARGAVLISYHFLINYARHY